MQLSPKALMPGHEHPIYALSISQKNHILFSGGGEAAVVEWSLKRMEHIKVLFKTSGSIYNLLSTEHYPYLLSADKNGQLSIFDFEQQKLVFQKQVAAEAIFAMAQLGSVLYYVSQDGYLRSFDLEKFTLIEQVKISDQALRSVCIDKLSNNIYVAGKDLLIYQLSLSNLKVINTYAGHTLPIFTLAYDNINGQLLSGARDAQVKSWTPLKEENIAAHMFAVNDISLMNESNYFATASMDKSIKIWDKKSHELKAIADPQKNTGHNKSVNRLAYTSFENYLISCSDDRMIRVWELKQDA